MAVLSDYTDGTITVTNGSVDFTGTNTLWRSAAFREGDTVLLQGFTGVIAGTSDDDPLILSNTTGQFTEPWPGASGTFAYRMRYQPDNARFSAKSTALINLLANGILRGIADIGVQDGKLLIGNVAGLYDLIDKSELGIQDPNGSLGKLAALTLAANKFLNTDGSGNLIQSDIAAWAISMLGLVGAANKFPYLNAANTAALADITSEARTMLASATPAVTSLGYTPLNRAGDTVQASLGVLANLNMGGSIILPPPTGQVYALSGTSTITIAQSGPFIAPNFSGLMIVTNINQGGTMGIVCGGGSIAAAFQVGTHNIGNLTYAQNENGYAFFNLGGAANFSVILIRTRDGA